MNKRKQILYLSFMILIIIHSQSCKLYACEGMEYCMYTVIPTLFPILFLSNLIVFGSTGVGGIIRILSRIVHIPEGMEGIILPSFLGGYPAGAQCLHQLHDRVGKETYDYLMGFCNNPGPAVILGLCSTCFTDPIVPWIIWIILLISSLAASYIIPNRMLPPMRKESNIQSAPTASISFCLQNSISALKNICGYIILFRVICGFIDQYILHHFPNSLRVLILGILDAMNGLSFLNEIPNEKIRFLVCVKILSLGGVCVYLQIKSITNKHGTGLYLIGKMISTCIAMLLSFISGIFLFSSSFSVNNIKYIIIYIFFLFILYIQANMGRYSRRIHV